MDTTKNNILEVEIDIEKKLCAQCTGCGLCAKTCFLNAITMESNMDGFLYPVINNDICIKCGKCILECQKKVKLKREVPQESYVCYNREAVKSSSGGVFFTIANYIINVLEGIVIGCIFTEHGDIKHICTDNINDVYKMQGSKYVQSNIESIYEVVKRYLEEGRYVFFSGTPCEVSAIKVYCYGLEERLFCADIVCHGVPAPLVWKKQYNELEKQYGKIDKFVGFRRKTSRNSNDFSLIFQVNGKNRVIPYYKNKYYKDFILCKNLRQKCYSCDYACPERCGDITMGDCATTNNYLEFHKGLGISICLLNSEKGKLLWQRCLKDCMKYQELNLGEEIKNNKQLNRPAEICEDYLTAKYIFINEKIKKILPIRIKTKIKLILRKLI